MKRLIFTIVFLLVAAACFADWAIETGDNEVSTANEVVAAYTDTVVTQRISRGQLVAEIAALEAERAGLVIRNAEITARINWINNTALPFIDARLPAFKATGDE